MCCRDGSRLGGANQFHVKVARQFLSHSLFPPWYARITLIPVPFNTLSCSGNLGPSLPRRKLNERESLSYNPIAHRVTCSICSNSPTFWNRMELCPIERAQWC